MVDFLIPGECWIDRPRASYLKTAYGQIDVWRHKTKKEFYCSYGPVGFQKYQLGIRTMSAAKTVTLALISEKMRALA